MILNKEELHRILQAECLVGIQHIRQPILSRALYYVYPTEMSRQRTMSGIKLINPAYLCLFYILAGIKTGMDSTKST